MAKKQYVSLMIEVNALNDEDIITASVYTTDMEIDGEMSKVTVGGFNAGWLN